MLIAPCEVDGLLTSCRSDAGASSLIPALARLPEDSVPGGESGFSGLLTVCSSGPGGADGSGYSVYVGGAAGCAVCDTATAPSWSHCPSGWNMKSVSFLGQCSSFLLRDMLLLTERVQAGTPE